jgi:hypothetical protein
MGFLRQCKAGEVSKGDETMAIFDVQVWLRLPNDSRKIVCFALSTMTMKKMTSNRDWTGSVTRKMTALKRYRNISLPNRCGTKIGVGVACIGVRDSGFILFAGMRSRVTGR